MMGKKKDLRNLFKESIDPRFSGVFNSNKNHNTGEKSLNDSHPSTNIEADYKHSRANKNVGFQNFISARLTEYLDKHIKEVDRPVLENDFFANRIEGICLFSGSDVITEEQPVELVQHKPMKKKRKKEKHDKESFKEVAVNYEWIQNQAQLLKS